MPLYRITLSYDGTDFSGWQTQKPRAATKESEARTVQGTLEAALALLAGGEPVAVVGAGRTDAGVHALGQVASFELAGEVEPQALQKALNGLLPRDVRVLDVGPAPEGFNARRSARAKFYRYELDTGQVQVPLRRRWAGHVPCILNEERVGEAAAHYRGRHDFAALASSGGSVKTTVRHVTRSDVRFVPAVWEGGEAPGGASSERAFLSALGPTLVYEVEADGFLRRMVRSLVGGLVAVGRGVLSVDEHLRALDARDRRRWPPPVAARGLTLVRVDYPPGC